MRDYYRSTSNLTDTASYSVNSSDKSTKSASVQEANITGMVNGIQRYLKLSVREGEGERSSAHQGQEPVDHYEFYRRSQHFDIARCQEHDCPSDFRRSKDRFVFI